jgi:hypothetical protein
VAHADGGDAKSDSMLYDAPGGRDYIEVFIDLYGVHPGIVKSTGKQSSINNGSPS